MYTRPSTRSRFAPCGARTALILGLAGGAAVLGVGCGGDGGGVAPVHTVSITLAGTGGGTVLGSAGGLSCTNGSGGVPASGTCQVEVENGTQLTLTASPATQSSFTGWSGNGVSCPASAPCTITVTESRTITATFDAAATTQLLTVVGGGSGTGSGTVVSDPAGIACTISGGTAGGAGCSSPFPTGTPVQLQVASGSLVAWGGACAGTTCSTTMSESRTVIATFSADAEATQLAFVGQPSGVQVGNVIAPAVQVAVQDTAGLTVGGRSDPITLRIATNPGAATLGGQLTRNAVNGVATFPDLTLNQVGTGYTLAAAAAGLPEATSAPFNVNAEAVAQLVFSVQPPSTTAAGAPIAVTVQIRDAAGAILTTRTDEIAIDVQNNPGGQPLGGTRTATAVAGVATFSNLTLQTAATGYTLAVSTPDASGATSTSFAIVAGPARLVVINSTNPQSAPVSTAVAVRPSVKVTDAFNNPVEGVPVRWEVTAGDGDVVASTTDPVVRPTGPLGLSTAVSWTLGTEVGTSNNELRASVALTGIVGSPVIFTGSGTIPSGQGIFTGTLKQTNNAGQLLGSIAGAALTFVNLNTGATAGNATSKSDGSFSSPPLAAGTPYRINVEATSFKAITFAKPSLNSGGVLSLGNLGMVVGSDEDGEAGLQVTVHLSDEPTASTVPVRIDVYEGYYFGEDDPELIIDSDSTGFNEEQLFPTVSDWGILTIRVSATGYETFSEPLVFDNPNAFRELEVTLDPE